MKNLYIKIEVWEQCNEKTMYCYHIFQNLVNSRYMVQSKDTIRIAHLQDDLLFSRKQSIELFTETPPCMREGSYCSIQEAIDQFNTAFAE
jgi:hypothetical protein